MKRLFKFIISFAALFVALWGFSKMRTVAAEVPEINVVLEQQEGSTSGHTMVRYVSTISNCTESDLGGIKTIKVHLTISKPGQTTQKSTQTMNTVYRKITGTKEAADNTFYAVYTLKNTDSFNEWTLACQFEYVFTDNTSVSTNVKSYIINHQHSYVDGEYQSDEASHWQVCDRCSVITPVAHTWVAASCTEARHCSECGYSDGEALGHTGGTATCNAKAVCTRCGQSYGELNSKAHTWTAASCTAPRTCSTCGETDGEALGHTGGTATCSAQATCVRCGEAYGALNPDKHTYTSEVITASTCSVAGTKRYTCSDCEASYDVSLDKTAHTYVATVTPATCTASGYTTYTCSVCGATYKDNYTLPTGHAGGTATCTELAKCSACGEEYGALAAHNYSEATCTTPGTCSSCGAIGTNASGHSWNSGAVTKTPTCTEEGVFTYTCTLCNKTKTNPIAKTSHDYEAVVTISTCSQRGYTTYTCANCSDSYKDSYTDKLAHTWNQDRTCTEGHSCTKCDASEPALGHSYACTKTVNATCTEDGYKTYTCSKCNDTFNTANGTATGHNISGVTAVEALKDGETCIYVQSFECKKCHEAITGNEVTHHSLKTVIVTEANCAHAGEKKTTCTKCDYETTTVIAKNDTHTWDEGTKSGNVTTYTCTVTDCGETKKVVEANATNTTVSKDDLTTAGTVKLSNSEIKMDAATLAGLEGEVSVSSDTLSAEDKATATESLSEDAKALLGDSPVYNFTVSDQNGAVSNFDGKVTVTLPYTLADGENVDDIVVWYIGSDGNVTNIKAEYANGYVTFETTHFSYYSVSKMTPAERCALYGHTDTEKVVNATCLEDGYTLHYCIRCGRTEKTNVVDALGHALSTTSSSAATCTAQGVKVDSCSRCSYTSVTKTEATGHSYALYDSKAATCTAEGYTKYKCSSCAGTYTTAIAALGHNYTTSKVNATCESSGYTSHKCSRCDNEYMTDFEVVSHNYTVVFAWNADHTEATATITCDKGCNLSEEITAEVATTITEATCGAKGSTNSVAQVIYAGNTYKDTYSAEIAALAHSYVSKYNETKHYEECENCSAVRNEVKHSLTDSIIAEATCKSVGSKVSTCACGYSVKSDIAKKEHNIVTTVVPATCTEDGSTTKTCSLCGDESSEAITKLGHNYVVSAGSEATCGAAGSATYTCTNCNDSYNQELTKLSHEYEKTEVAPTCTTGGYDLYVCKNCNDSYKKNEIDALGHKYAATYSWDSSYATCTVTFTCSNDKTHVFTRNAEIAVESTPATCSDKGETAYTATVKYNDVSYKDTKVVKTAATGVHNYVNGVCTACGKVYSSCDHTELNEYTINLGQLGACNEGTLIYEACSCGEVKRIKDFSNFEPCKDFEQGGSKKPEVDENGKEYYLMTYSCSTCGLEMYARGYSEKDENCKETNTYIYTISISDFSIEGLIDSYTNVSHNFESNVVKLDSVKCGLTITEQKCKTCGKITGRDIESYCSWATDEKACTDKHWVSYCEKCGLKMVVDETQTVDGCTIIHEYDTKYFFTEDSILYEYISIWEEIDHDWKYTVTYKDESLGCEGRWNCTRICNKCDEVSTSSGKGHDYAKENITVANKDNIPCINYHKEYCNLCGEVFEVRFDFLVDVDGSKVEKEIDGMNHVIQTATAKEYNFVATIDEWVESTLNACQTINHGIYTITIDGEEYENVTIANTSSNHKYNTEIILNGETCEDGYTVVETCSICGDSNSYPNRGHYYTESKEEYNDKNGTGIVYVYGKKCKICNRYDYCEVKLTNVVDYSNETKEVDGVKHSIYTEYSKDKAIAVTRDEYTTVISACSSQSVILYTVVIDGEVIFTAQSVSQMTNHSYTVSNCKMFGLTCDDGWEATFVCSVCGEEHNQYGNGHYGDNKFSTLIELEEGKLGISYTECIICNGIYNENWDCNWAKFTNDVVGPITIDGLEYTRVKLGLGDEKLEWYNDYRVLSQYGCTSVSTGFINIKYDNKQLVHYAYTGKNVNHEVKTTYTLDGKRCEDGVTYTNTCSKCGEIIYQDHIKGHIWSSDDRVDAKVEGDNCLVEIDRSVCFTCGIELGFESITGMQGAKSLNPVTIDEVEYNATQLLFEDEKLEYYIYERLLSKDGCIETYRKIYNIKYDGEQIVYAGYTYVNDMHNYQTTYTLKGKTCDEGWIKTTTCTRCGDSFGEMEGKGHIKEADTIVIEEGCGTYIKYEGCPVCGDYSYFDVSGYKTTESKATKVVDGVTHTITTYTCEKCSYVYTKDSYFIGEGCTGISYFTYTFPGEKADTVITGKVATNNHEYTSVITYNNGYDCENGGYLVKTCSVCGEKESVEFGCHRTSTTTVYESSTVSTCGTVRVYLNSCDNCDYKYYSLSYECNMSWDDKNQCDKCTNCGLYFMTLEVSSKKVSDCITVVTYNYIVYDSTDNVIFADNYDAVHTNHSMKLISSKMYDEKKNCEEGGWTATYECEKCKYVQNSSGYWHNYVNTDEITFNDGYTCEGGYTVTKRCQHCGDEAQSTGRYCNTASSELIKYETTCGTFVMIAYICNTCHNTSWTSVNKGGCEFDYSFENNTDTYTCRNCGFSYAITNTQTIELNTCLTKQVKSYVFSLGSEILATKELTYINANHEFEATNVSLNGKACSDGWTATIVCKNCNASYVTSDNGHYSKETNEIIELEKNSIDITVSKCMICNETNYLSFPEYNFECTTTRTEDDGAITYITTGTYYNDKNVTFVKTQVIDNLNKDCYGDATYTIVFYNSGTSVYEAEWTSYGCYHNYAETRTLNVDGGSCTDGITIISSCTQCNRVLGTYSVTEHVKTTVKKIVMPDGSTVKYDTCLCGSEPFISKNLNGYECNYNTYEEDGITYYVDAYSNGSYVLKDTYYSEKDGCTITYHHDVAAYNGADLFDTYSYVTTSMEHNYEYTYTFKDSTNPNCEDGVTIISTCKDCGYKTTSKCSYHNRCIKTTYDLAEYGSECGGTVTVTSCPCGYNSGINLNRIGDFEYTYANGVKIAPDQLDEFVSYSGGEGSIHDYWIYTYSCAVTDPECGFVYRTSDAYFSIGDCMARQYRVYQFGYDSETGKCQLEIRIPTDYYNSLVECHTYVQTTSEKEVDGYTVKTSNNVCSECGAVYNADAYYKNGAVVKRVCYQTFTGNSKYTSISYTEICGDSYSDYEKTWIYVLTNGSIGKKVSKSTLGTYHNDELQSRVDLNYVDDVLTEKHEWAEIIARRYSSNIGIRLYDRFYYYKHGELNSWERTDYEFITDYCEYNIHHTSSDGTDELSFEENHFMTSTSSFSATCSQVGHAQEFCVFCYNSSDAAPLGHDFVEQEDGTYVCSRCDLESSTGVNGTIILEDLSSSAAYIMGYYNPTHVEYKCYAVLIVVVDGVEKEVVLDENAIDIRNSSMYLAYQVSKSEVKTVANDLGYTEYQFRLSLVPVDNLGNYDYSITFSNTVKTSSGDSPIK